MDANLEVLALAYDHITPISTLFTPDYADVVESICQDWRLLPAQVEEQRLELGRNPFHSTQNDSYVDAWIPSSPEHSSVRPCHRFLTTGLIKVKLEHYHWKDEGTGSWTTIAESLKWGTFAASLANPAQKTSDRIMCITASTTLPYIFFGTDAVASGRRLNIPLIGVINCLTREAFRIPFMLCDPKGRTQIDPGTDIVGPVQLLDMSSVQQYLYILCSYLYKDTSIQRCYTILVFRHVDSVSTFTSLANTTVTSSSSSASSPISLRSPSSTPRRADSMEELMIRPFHQCGFCLVDRAADSKPVKGSIAALAVTKGSSWDLRTESSSMRCYWTGESHSANITVLGTVANRRFAFDARFSPLAIKEPSLPAKVWMDVAADAEDVIVVLTLGEVCSYALTLDRGADGAGLLWLEKKSSNNTTSGEIRSLAVSRRHVYVLGDQLEILRRRHSTSPAERGESYVCFFSTPASQRSEFPIWASAKRIAVDRYDSLLIPKGDSIVIGRRQKRGRTKERRHSGGDMVRGRVVATTKLV